MALDFEGLAKEAGAQILAQTKTQMGAAWSELSAEATGGLERAALCMGRCKLLAAAGRDVSADVADIEAQVLNWSWTGASIAKRNFWLAVLHVCGVAAQVLGVVVGSLASAALARLGVSLPPVAVPPPSA